jgi:hypothetical protein
MVKVIFLTIFVFSAVLLTKVNSQVALKDVVQIDVNYIDGSPLSGTRTYKFSNSSQNELEYDLEVIECGRVIFTQEGYYKTGEFSKEQIGHTAIYFLKSTCEGMIEVEMLPEQKKVVIRNSFEPESVTLTKTKETLR